MQVRAEAIRRTPDHSLRELRHPRKEPKVRTVNSLARRNMVALVTAVAVAILCSIWPAGPAGAKTTTRPATRAYTWDGMHLTATQYEAVQILQITRQKGMKLPKNALGITTFGSTGGRNSKKGYDMCLRFSGMCITTDPVGDGLAIIGAIISIVFGVKGIKAGKGGPPPKTEPEERDTDVGVDPSDSPPTAPDREEGDEPDVTSGGSLRWAPAKDCSKSRTQAEECTWISLKHEGGLEFESLYFWYKHKGLYITCPHWRYSQHRSTCKIEKNFGKAGKQAQTWVWNGPIHTRP
jgi:hypothetical protein